MHWDAFHFYKCQSIVPTPLTQHNSGISSNALYILIKCLSANFGAVSFAIASPMIDFLRDVDQWTKYLPCGRIPDAQKRANLLSNIQALINPDLYVKTTYLTFSQHLSTFINVYCCKGSLLLITSQRIWEANDYHGSILNFTQNLDLTGE